MALQADAVHLVLGQQIALGSAPLDKDFGEVLVEEDTLQLGRRVERNLDDLGLAVGVGREVADARALGAAGDVVFAVAGDGGHAEALDVVVAFRTVTVDAVVDGALVVLLVDAQPQHVLAHEELVGHAHNLELAVAVEDDDVVDVRAVADELVLLQTRADEAVGAVDVQLLVGLDHLRGFDGVEVAYLRQAGVLLAVLLLQEQEPLRRHLHKVGQVALYLLYLGTDAGHQLVGLVFVELQNALHLDFQKAQYVVLGHLAHHLRVVGCQALVDVLADGVNVGSLLELLVLVDALLYEYLFQRLEVQLLQQFVLSYLQLLADEVLGALYTVAQHVADGQELRLVVLDDTAVGRNVDLAV